MRSHITNEQLDYTLIFESIPYWKEIVKMKSITKFQHVIKFSGIYMFYMVNVTRRK